MTSGFDVSVLHTRKVKHANGSGLRSRDVLGRIAGRMLRELYVSSSTIIVITIASSASADISLCISASNKVSRISNRWSQATRELDRGPAQAISTTSELHPLMSAVTISMRSSNSTTTVALWTSLSASVDGPVITAILSLCQHCPWSRPVYRFHHWVRWIRWKSTSWRNRANICRSGRIVRSMLGGRPSSMGVEG